VFAIPVMAGQTASSARQGAGVVAVACSHAPPAAMVPSLLKAQTVLKPVAVNLEGVSCLPSDLHEPLLDLNTIQLHAFCSWPDALCHGSSTQLY